MELERTALPSVGISPCLEDDPSLGSLCEPVSCPRNLLEDESDKRQVHLLKAAAEGVGDPSGDTECCAHLRSEKSGGGRYTTARRVSSEHSPLPLRTHGRQGSDLQNFINHNYFSCESRD